MNEDVFDRLYFIEFHDGQVESIHIGGNSEVVIEASISLMYDTDVPKTYEVWRGTARCKITGIRAFGLFQSDPQCWRSDNFLIRTQSGETFDDLLPWLGGGEIASLNIPFQSDGYLELQASFLSIEVERLRFLQRRSFNA